MVVSAADAADAAADVEMTAACGSSCFSAAVAAEMVASAADAANLHRYGWRSAIRTNEKERNFPLFF